MKKMSIREQVATKFETTPINKSINLLKQRITRRLCQGSGDNLVNQVTLQPDNCPPIFAPFSERSLYDKLLLCYSIIASFLTKQMMGQLSSYNCKSSF